MFAETERLEKEELFNSTQKAFDDYRPKEWQLHAATALHARVRGKQARSRNTVVTAPMISLSVVLPTSDAPADAPSRAERVVEARDQARVSCQCSGIAASWSDVQGFGASCQIVMADPPMADAPLENARELRGNVVLIERGACSFGDKANAAQAAGALGVIFVDIGEEDLVAPQHNLELDGDITIPAVCISEADGARLQEMLGGLSIGVVSVNWSVLTYQWAARRIQKAYVRRRVATVAAAIVEKERLRNLRKDLQARIEAKVQRYEIERLQTAVRVQAAMRGKWGRRKHRMAKVQAARQREHDEISSATKIAAVVRGKAARKRVKRVRQRTMDLESRFFKESSTSPDEEEQEEEGDLMDEGRGHPLRAVGEAAEGSSEREDPAVGSAQLRSKSWKLTKFDAAAVMDDIGATVAEEDEAVVRVQAAMRGKWGRRKHMMAKVQAARGFFRSISPDLRGPQGTAAASTVPGPAAAQEGGGR